MRIFFTIISFLSASIIWSQDAIYPIRSLGADWNILLEFERESEVNPFASIHTFSRNSHRFLFDTGVSRILLLRMPSTYFEHFYVQDNLQGIQGNKKIKKFFPNSLHGIFLKKDQHYLTVNPLLHVQLGNQQSGKPMQINTRGIEARGSIAGVLGFYTRLTENQEYQNNIEKNISDTLGFVHGIGFRKIYNKTGVDFFSAQGYITFQPIKQHLSVFLGHDRLFIGNGYRSLILSDFSKEYFHLRLLTHVGKFTYQNIYAQLNDFIPLTGNTLIPKKYMVNHRLSVVLGKKWEIGFTEMVVFQRDSQGGREFEYLNPIIFYRAVESNLGSHDNSLIAFDFKGLLPFRTKIYGQWVLDELNTKYLTSNQGWWANKWGLQLGIKKMMVVNSENWIFFTLEHNRVTPYTYSHYNKVQSYSHYGQPLAHPWGANFNESIVQLEWIKLKGLNMKWRWNHVFILGNRGLDTWSSGRNYGGNILRDNDTRVKDFGNQMLQGAQQKTVMYFTELGYALYRDVWVYAQYRLQQLTGYKEKNYQWFGVGIRVNFNDRERLF